MAKKRKKGALGKKPKTSGGNKSKTRVISDGFWKALAVALGIGGSVAAIKLLKGTVPAWAEPLVAAAPGTVLLFMKNSNLQLAGIGAISIGAIDGLNKLTSGKEGVMATVNSLLPKISGLGQFNPAVKRLLGYDPSAQPLMGMGNYAQLPVGMM